MINVDETSKLIVSKFYNNGIDLEFQLGPEKTRIIAEDINTKVTIGIIVGNSIEDALAELVTKFALDVKRIKNGKTDQLSIL